MFPQILCAQEKTFEDTPWNRAALEFGFFATTINSNLRLGSGVGIDIDVEKILGMNSNNQVFRLKGFWRFSKNKRHRMDLGWFSFNRSGSNKIARDIIIEGPDGKEIEIKAGTEVRSYLDLDIYKGLYSYSLFLDDRLDLALGVGLYVMPIEAGLRAAGAIDTKVDESFTAPLPVFSIRTDILITPKWFFRTGAEVFYLAIDDYVGNIIATYAALEYKPWKRIGLGAGADFTRLYVESNDFDVPGVDFKGTVEFEFAGVELFAKLYF